MMLRDAPGFAWYFMAYELLKRNLVKLDKNIGEKPGLQSAAQLFAGGFAGTTTWIICYPADFLKTRLQTAEPGCSKGVFQLG